MTSVPDFGPSVCDFTGAKWLSWTNTCSLGCHVGPMAYEDSPGIHIPQNKIKVLDPSLYLLAPTCGLNWVAK